MAEALDSYGCMTEWHEAQRFLAAVVASPSTTASLLVAVAWEEDAREPSLSNLTEGLGQQQHLQWVAGGDFQQETHVHPALAEALDSGCFADALALQEEARVPSYIQVGGGTCIEQLLVSNAVALNTQSSGTRADSSLPGHRPIFVRFACQTSDSRGCVMPYGQPSRLPQR